MTLNLHTITLIYTVGALSGILIEKVIRWWRDA